MRFLEGFEKIAISRKLLEHASQVAYSKAHKLPARVITSWNFGNDLDKMDRQILINVKADKLNRQAHKFMMAALGKKK